MVGVQRVEAFSFALLASPSWVVVRHQLHFVLNLFPLNRVCEQAVLAKIGQFGLREHAAIILEPHQHHGERKHDHKARMHLVRE